MEPIAAAAGHGEDEGWRSLRSQSSGRQERWVLVGKHGRCDSKGIVGSAAGTF